MRQLKFRSDARLFLRKYTIYSATLIAGLIGIQIFKLLFFRGSSTYEDLLYTVLFGCGFLVFISVVVLLAVYLFPITVTAKTIRCYSRSGWYHTFRWDEIVYVELVSPYGIPYLEVSSKKQDAEIAVPVWLKGWSDFSEFVQTHAGKDNPLAQAVSFVESDRNNGR